MPDSSLSPAVERLMEVREERRGANFRDRERIAEFAVGGAFMASALALAVLAPWERSFDLVLVAALVVAYALCARVEFYVGAGYTLPTQIIFVPMLFLAPVPLVPLLVAAGLILAVIPDRLSGQTTGPRIAMAFGDSFHALGPALVFVLAGLGAADLADVHWYLAALAAQFAFDAGISTVAEWIRLGIAPRLQLRLLAWVYLVDSLLAPVGLLAALAAASQPYAFLLAVPLVMLLGIFARERRARIDGALELSRAYRGTALLLGDVVESDDEYTGAHSRDVVTLALAVADRMGLDEGTRRDLEFAALLHDVGKIRIPKEIINKEGPLNDDEWALMRTHTVEGERLLERVGGVLGTVGRIVRSCHERWDGDGYPDGLAGERIPLAARVIFCCDAFNAMTTDRPYRAAMSDEDAVAELRACAGTQFDPRVARAVIDLVSAERADEVTRLAVA